MEYGDGLGEGREGKGERSGMIAEEIVDQSGCAVGPFGLDTPSQPVPACWFMGEKGGGSVWGEQMCGCRRGENLNSASR